MRKLKKYFQVTLVSQRFENVFIHHACIMLLLSVMDPEAADGPKLKKSVSAGGFSKLPCALSMKRKFYS
jgi:hypothetical protein